MAVDASTTALSALRDEAEHHDNMATEMARIAGEGCGSLFAEALRTVGRTHRIKAIALRAEIATLRSAV